ncbi:biotin transporter BioY [Rhodovulum adriaticum]|uniref:Biotin transporter n=1 Tax=Rhodovulum adriaticum TaxID=35804 RepID=A0A4R2NTZ1_RHOAD|nr:biotin transporter BioY [Rhodovulum adriaticum]MBK1636185.1 biotin transporter BioY [Rhodovulum adriaticum]TCP25503.1 biotin transport system substrate-specific component [Rhodovulum adriaticum]
MAQALTEKVLAEKLLPQGGAALRVKQLLLVVAGIAVLAVAAKIRVPMWPSPVPVTMGTFAVLTIGAAYGPRLGLATILGYMAIGALGFDVFASSSAELNGVTYMMGGTGGYLLGYVLATLALGLAARRGLDRSVLGMGAALLVGNALIYVPGVLWLNQFTSGWAQTLEWGLTPYLIGDAMKLGLAALMIPAVWKLVGRARD